jgi:hypothetical protein
MYWEFLGVVKVELVEAMWYLTSGLKYISVRIPRIYCLICAEFGIRNLHIMLLSMCEFRENQPKGGSL